MIFKVVNNKVFLIFVLEFFILLIVFLLWAWRSCVEQRFLKCCPVQQMTHTHTHTCTHTRADRDSDRIWTWVGSSLCPQCPTFIFNFTQSCPVKRQDWTGHPAVVGFRRDSTQVNRGQPENEFSHHLLAASGWCGRACWAPRCPRCCWRWPGTHNPSRASDRSHGPTLRCPQC